MGESAKQKAEREARSGGGGKSLPVWWKMLIYVTAGILSFGKLVYSIGWFNIVTADNCVMKPSGFDVMFNDVTSAASLVFFVMVIAGFHHLENR